MVAVAEIKDRESLEVWLRGRSREDAICIAHRAAMRVAPLYWYWFRLGEDRAQNGDLTPLNTLWPLLTSGAARDHTSPEVEVVAAARRFATVATATAATAFRSVTAATAAYAAADATSAAAAIDAATAARAAADTVTAARAATAATANAAATAFWRGVRLDCAALEAGRDPFGLPLWDGLAPEPIPVAWARTRGEWAKAGGPVWAFWTQFYENALAGHAQDWPLLRDIALIPAEDWQGGPERVHPVIERMLKQRKRTAISAGAMPSLPQIQTAVKQNLPVLLVQFDALEALIALEVERLQSRNYPDHAQAEEAKRLTGVFLAMHAAVTQLRALLPESGTPNTATAEKMKTLMEIYRDEFVKWPRDNAPELVNSTCRVILVGASTSFFVFLGTPAAYAAGLAGRVLGGRKLVDPGETALAALAQQ
jgi:hypothetical protein